MNQRTIAQKRALVKDTVILGVDIGKFWHVACALLPNGEFLKPIKLYNDGQGFTILLDYLAQARTQAGVSAVLIGFESTGHYWENLAYWLERRDLKIVQVNPLHTKKMKDLMDNSPLKTDSKDARVIADLVSQGKFLSLVLPKGVFAELRMLMTGRARLVKEKTARLNLIHQFVDRFFPEFTKVFPHLGTKTALFLVKNFLPPQRLLSTPGDALRAVLTKRSRGKVTARRVETLAVLARQSIGISEGGEALSPLIRQAVENLEETQTRIKEIEQLAQEALGKIPEAQFLLSVKGIGPIIAATLLGEVGDMYRYHYAPEIIKLAGLNLYEVSSGIHRGYKRITKRGRALLRHTLYLAAVLQAKRGMPLHEFYGRLQTQGKPKAKIFIAVACKLVRLLFALVRDRRHYTDQPPVACGQAV